MDRTLRLARLACPGRKAALLAAVCLLAACAHDARREPPSDPRKRREAETAACFRREVPAWLDDGALASAVRQDRLEGEASRANDSFRGGAFVAQPPLPAGGPRVSALLEERRRFEDRCRLLRASGKPATKL
jgi:hypothetical protein